MGLTKKFNYPGGSSLKFDKIFINNGDGYDRGIFTVKTPGIYMFHFHGLSVSGEEMWLELYRYSTTHRHFFVMG